MLREALENGPSRVLCQAVSAGASSLASCRRCWRHRTLERCWFDLWGVTYGLEGICSRANRIIKEMTPDAARSRPSGAYGFAAYGITSVRRLGL